MTRLGPGDVGFTPALDSVLRRIRAEAVRVERILLADQLDRELGAASRADPRTKEGRLAHGLATAVDLVAGSRVPRDLPWDEFIGGVGSAVDSIDVGIQVADVGEPGGLDPYPVRVYLSDGADDSAGTAYFTIAEAQQLITHLCTAVARAAAAQPGPGC